MASKYSIIFGTGSAIATDPLTQKRLLQADTLITQGFAFQTTAEDIRAGYGNALIARYFHDNGINFTLEDVRFSLEYIALQTGSQIVRNKTTLLKSTSAYVKENGEIDISKLAVGSFLPTVSDKKGLWYRRVTDPRDATKFIPFEDGMTEINVGVVEAGIEYCIQYYDADAYVRSLDVISNFIPATVEMLLSYPLFAAGDTAAAQTQIGELQIKVPRFQFDGSMDFSMTSSGTSSVSIGGTALRVDANSCEMNYGGLFAQFVESRVTDTWYTGLELLELEDAELLEIGENVNNGPLTLVTDIVAKSYSLADIISLLEDRGLSGAFLGLFDDGNVSPINPAQLTIVSAISDSGTSSEAEPTVSDGVLMLNPVTSATESGSVLIGILDAIAEYQSITVEIPVTYTSP